MLRLSRFFRRQRLGIFALVLLETFFMAGGAEAVEARQQGILRAQAEDARMARAFGLAAAQWQVEAAPGWIERSAHVVADEAQEILDHSRTEVARLLDEIRGQEIQASLVTEVGQPSGSVDEELSASAAQPTRQIKPYIPRRAALESGEGERTVARAPRSAKLLPGLGGSTEDDLPLHLVQRKAQTIDASALPPSQKISSAIASASPRAQGVKANTLQANKSIAPEIVALAASLDNSPAKIFRYVHDQITYDPKWGVDSTPLGTLWEGRGTSWDQAWLLQELLIAAGIDARLEWGQVEIPPSLLTNLTGIDDPIRAGDFLTTAGLEVLLVIQGSQVSAARFPHVWVKAHLDYIPNRGVTPGTADTWIRMDPSITTHERTDGLRLDQDVPFMLADHLLSGTELSPRQDYEAALLAHVADQGLPVASLDDAKSLHRQVADEFPFVPGTLRAKIVSAAGESETVPAAFEQDVEVQIREEGGGALLSWTTTASHLYGKRLETVWLGATSSDQAALDLYGGIFATPPYEVELRPTLRLDGVEVASGTSIGSAEDAEIQLTLTPPDGSGAGDGIATVAGWDLFAGEHGVLIVDYGRAPPELADRFSQEALNAAGNDFETEGWQLAQAASSYLHNLGGDLTHLVDLSWHRLLTFNTAVFAVKRGAVSTSPDGTPQTFSPGPLALDVGAMPLAVMPVDGVQTSTVPTLELLGSQGSFREGEALASVFGGEHLTAVTFLTRAVREGQVVTKVDLSNLDDALAGAEISGDAKGAIRFAVEQLGMEAWISETQIESNTFQTTGYILIDPATGSGGYFVTFERRFTPLDGAVTFHNPIDLDVITAPTEVIASIDAEGLESWTLSTRPTGEEGTRVIATGTGPVDNTVLGKLDPTVLLNGMHDLVLTGRDAAGQTVSGRITVNVDGDMKLGNFTLSFSDLAVPLSGLDIEVVRTYDSRDRSVGDFGFGWTLDIKQGSYKNNRPPGDGWQILAGGGPLGLPCQQIQETKSHLTTIRLSDQEIYRFRLKLESPATVIGGCFARAVFDYVDGPLPGTRLEILGNDEVIYRNAANDVIDRNTLERFVPENVRLTTRDGRIFHLNLNNGVEHLEDLNGNALEITPDGITHSNGEGIEFIRDAEGRIVEIIDPVGNSNLYNYDGEGDLITFTDRSGAETRFRYTDHYLDDIVTANGLQAVRTEYDDAGRVVRIIDASGKVTDMQHDLEGRRELITDRLGNSRIHEYDARGNVVSETDAFGRVTSRTFDGRDNMLTETDPLGGTITYVYTADNRLQSVTDPLGQTTQYVFNERMLPERVIDPRGHAFESSYDNQNNLLRTVDALGGETAFVYDGDGNLTETTNALGQVTRYEYDGRGNQTRMIDALGNTIDFGYDNAGNETSVTRTRTLPDGSTETLVTLKTYDELGRLTSTTDENGQTTTFVLDPLGKVLQQTDSLGRTTTNTYDFQGLLTSTTYPDGTTDSQTFDAEGRLATRTDRAGRTTTYAYDAVGKLLHFTLPDGAVIATRYDAVGEMTERTDALGNTTRFAYDLQDRLTSVTDALGQITAFDYDGNGNRTSMTDALGRTWTTVYDELNRPIEEQMPDGSTVRLSYDALGRQVGLTDSAGKVTEFSYDALDRLTSVTDALDQVTTYGYDEVGNRITQTDALGRLTRFEYDRRGRQTARILPDGARATMAYNVHGTVASMTNFQGASSTFQYDVVNRLVQQTLPDGTTRSFTYTATDRLDSVTDFRGTTQYAYDLQDRLLEKVDPNGYALSYGYDAMGNRTSMTATVGAQVLTTAYAYDALNRLSTVTDPAGGVTTSTYDDNGNLAGMTYPNGVVTDYTYDSLNRLTELQTQDDQGSLLQSYQYTLGAMGNRTAVREADGTERQYQFDALYRLVQDRVVDAAQSVVYQQDFTYDDVGNRLTQTLDVGAGGQVTSSTYDLRDRLQTAGSKSYTWDVNGNLTQRNDGGAMDMGWDFDNRLRSMTLDDGTVVETDYDVDGNRVQTRVTPSGGATAGIDYLVDTSGPLSHVVAEIVDGQVTTHYSRASGQLVSLYRPASGQARYFHADGLGSVRALSDEAGVVTDRYTYSAIGVLLEHVGSDPQPYQFAGEPMDPNSGFYYNRARWLDVDSGRFLSMDPFQGVTSDPMSLHRYLYAHADPVNIIDPTGEVSAMSMAMGSLVGLGLSATAASITLKVLFVMSAVLAGIVVAEMLGPNTYLTGALDRFRGDGYWGPEIEHLNSTGALLAAWALMWAKLMEFRRNHRGKKKWNKNHDVEIQLPSAPGPEGDDDSLKEVYRRQIGRVTIRVMKGGKRGRVFQVKYTLGGDDRGDGLFLFRMDYLDYREDPEKGKFNVHCHIRLFPIYTSSKKHRSCDTLGILTPG